MKKFLVASFVLGTIVALPFAGLPVNAVDNSVEKGYMSVSYTTEKEVCLSLKFLHLFHRDLLHRWHISKLTK